MNLNLDANWSDAETVLNPRFATSSDYEAPTARVGRRFLLNGRLSYSFAFAAGSSAVFLAGENLTDEKYESRPGYPMPRAIWMTGMEVRF